MKVKQETVEAAILKLIDQITSTMPNTTYKFILGGTSALLTMKYRDKISQVLQNLRDDQGLIDLETLQIAIDGAFKASGNKVQLEFFNNSILNVFVKPITVTITKQDIDQIMSDLKQNSVSNEVTINPLSQTKIGE